MATAVSLAGVTLEVVVPDGPVPPGLALLMEHLPEAGLPADVTIRHSVAPPPVPDRPADIELGRLAVWVDEPVVHVRDVTGATARLTEGLAAVGGGGAAAANGFHALFLFALTHLLAHRDLFVLHGAGIVRSGRALVVLGGSGSGKSTLAVAAVEAGWGLLADDMVIVRRSGSSLEAAGVPRAVLVPDDAGWELPTRPNERDARARRFVDAALVSGWVPVGATIAVGHDDAPDGSLRQLAGQEVFAGVVGSFVSTPNPPLLRRFLPAAAALSRLPGWALGHGSDPRTRRAVAVALLTTLEARNA
jgi:hypothetical protein